MAIQHTCPGCLTIYDLHERLRGHKVRCKRCERSFMVGGDSVPRDHDEGEAYAPVEGGELNHALQTEPRPAAVAAPPRRSEPPAVTPARRSSSAAPPPRKPAPAASGRSSGLALFLIVGGAVTGLVFLIVAVLVILAFYPRSSNAPVATPTPTPAPVVQQPVFQPPPRPPMVVPPPPPNAFNPPAGDPRRDDFKVTISNVKVTVDRPNRLSYRADFQVTDGQPRPGGSYYLVFKSQLREHRTRIHILGQQGTVSGSFTALGSDMGPFEVEIQKTLGKDKVSNTLTVNVDRN